jgi:hypothetical protein
LAPCGYIMSPPVLVSVILAAESIRFLCMLENRLVWYNDGMVSLDSCCPHSSYRNLAGTIHGRLTVIRIVGRSSDGHLLWECRCSCKDATIVHVRSHSLTRSAGGTQSCGCLRREIAVHRSTSAWNKGKRYVIPAVNGNERIYTQKNAWAKAVRRVRGNVCEICGWDKACCDVHHRIAHNDGGQHTISNGIVVCPNHHRILHERGVCE